MGLIGELLMSVGKLLLICLVWTLFVVGTSIAWNFGKVFAELERQKAVALWLLNNRRRARAEGLDFENIQNPNEAENETKTKRRKR